ncbi:hypothetical protein MPTK1_7g00310 [Marchantia polymorpha subsp. ruderalis]|uniref:Small ribosomal subunit protein bS18c n=2 Tax=Marchantia polymorpha TaxID=3197 RepID=A0AAF6BUP3_MARPO|nr:hypothetical protein MARPO_0046s0093 [Marchantia polymorpha]BBN15727.1 hypothetical protein Mp_7g00310 [Marchantia polymorpha subsp. ruderalis]|eukprot:PTQ39280.1 hypothetical protein MARPO_0046s0093 [Marchantia polymorpha]
MSLSGWRLVRLRSGSVNFPSLDHLLNSWQQLGVGSSRSISVSTVDRLSEEGTGNGGPREPAEDSPQATGDKRLWRKWIEDRLAHSKAGGEERSGSSGADSLFEDSVTRSSLSADDVVGTSSSSYGGTSEVEEYGNLPFSSETTGSEEMSSSTYTRSQYSEDELVTPDLKSHVKETARETKGSIDLDALINESFKPSSFSGEPSLDKLRNLTNRDSPSASFLQEREPARSTSYSSKQKSPFPENAKRSALPSAAKPKPSGEVAQVSVEMQLPKVEALDDFEYRVLGTASDLDDTRDDDFLRELDEIGRSARGIREYDEGEEDSGADEDEDWDDDKAQVLTDLALSNLEEFDLEDEQRPYRLRADRLFFPGQLYDPEDLDISKPVAELEKPTSRTRKNYSSKEVCQIADFRNPRYLSNFLRESSRILPRRHHQVSAKAQRKINREIKTARVLGLMPFTSMGDAPFRFMRSRSDDDPYPGSEED